MVFVNFCWFYRNFYDMKLQTHRIFQAYAKHWKFLNWKETSWWKQKHFTFWVECTFSICHEEMHALLVSVGKTSATAIFIIRCSFPRSFCFYACNWTHAKHHVHKLTFVACMNDKNNAKMNTACIAWWITQMIIRYCDSCCNMTDVLNFNLLSLKKRGNFSPKFLIVEFTNWHLQVWKKFLYDKIVKIKKN